MALPSETTVRTHAVPRSEVSPVFAAKCVLVVGVGGLGCASLAALATASVGRWILVDEDDVDETNLHRQVLYSEADVGRPKLEAARDALVRRGVNPEHIELRHGRVLPDNAREWFKDVDLVLEGADNYATKFLVADACHLERKPVVHGAAVGWNATVFLVPADGKPCYRCLFEDLPTNAGGNCDSVGVLGPVVGIAGGLMADQALRCLSGDAVSGVVHTLDGKSGRLRAVHVKARRDCALCGDPPRVLDTEWHQYEGPACATG
jgi:molybdopterin/thiamine biosynthesis adenylyltransferase